MREICDSSRPEREPHPILGPNHQIFLMENHDEAFFIWRHGGQQERILIHIDAHDDMWWTTNQASVTIANFISLALQEGMVKEVFWVIPDKTWETPKNLRPILRRLKKVCTSYPGNSPSIKSEPNQIFTSVLGKPVRVCTLDNLPRFEEQVLLDIDVDFLVIPGCLYSDELPVLPWCWPDELLARLKDKVLRTDLVTISYSVEGGYTPLKWKYLGDELAMRLGQPRYDGAKLPGMDQMRAAAVGAQKSDLASAETSYLEAIELLPGCAAPYYHLAHLFLQMGRNGQAPEVYRQALALDPSYRTAYNSAGIRHYAQRRFQEAEIEHRRTLALDSEDPYAHLGLGRLAMKRKRWREAEVWLRKSLALQGDLVDAHRSLGKVLTRQGRPQEAIAAYERSLTLSLKGNQPLTGCIATNWDEPRLVDPEHFMIHGRLARLYAVQGDIARAISSYRLMVAKGGDGVLPRSRLARLYLKQGQWRQAALEALQAVKMIPWELWYAANHLRKAGRRLFRRVRSGLRRAGLPIGAK